ncbi:carbohydrate kinase [Salinicoccus sp. ID82-1]|uniref:carbohydrate kinase family protein n=1 Tax=Salinicoccus sp. ID82-1 TaxID=2820269 RepID=UPI001F43DAEF|nr:carbohydrate kinase [Salinicoccus sp. ID82-1]MCG1010145.1 carbohydrate kinase [Salinicoccus sp. ID82-1]
MKRLYTIGEALIDFIPAEKGKKLKDINAFEPQVGGAPANVAAAHAILGGESYLLTQLGTDAFGDRIIELLESKGVHTDYITRTGKANTGLAFVSLDETGNRDFSFYRNPSADLLYDGSAVKDIDFHKEDLLHFCSVDLVESTMKETHRTVIGKMKEAGGTVVFDPNIRLPLWEDKDACRAAVREFMKYADIIKISDEELEFITGIKNESDALSALFTDDVEAVIYTKGPAGSEIIYREGGYCEHPGFEVDTIDTTGAGDAFIGAVLYQLSSYTKPAIDALKENGPEILRLANAVGALSTTRKGAIMSIPSYKEADDLTSSI